MAAALFDISFPFLFAVLLPIRLIGVLGPIGAYSIDAFLHWNQKMNLKTVKERGEVMMRHVEDSLALIPRIRSSYIRIFGNSCEELSMVDVGTEAVLPGLILAVEYPGDGRQQQKKRAKVLGWVARHSGLQYNQLHLWRAIFYAEAFKDNNSEG